MGFVSELKRRNVFRVGTIYVVGSWILLQVADLLFDLLELPGWTLKFVFGLLILGAPVALVLAWAYELTPEGLRRDADVEPGKTKLNTAGRRLDFVIIAMLAIAVVYFSVDKFVLQESQTTSTESQTSEFERSVAALPLVNHGGDLDSQAFASGFHDDLLTQLTKIPDLRVVSRTSVREYAGTSKNMGQIGEELSVKHILEGGVQKAGDRIRINVQLIDATTDSHLWAETYDRELTTTNIFAIQSEIARETARVLRVTLSPGTSASLSSLPTADLGAYKDYIGAILILDDSKKRLNTSDFQQGIELLKSAVERDPQFALAWVRLADELRWKVHDIDPGISSREALARAEAIDPHLPQIHLLRASYAFVEDRFEDALLELDLAEQGMPGEAEVLRRRYWLLRRMGRRAEAFANIERALKLDPQGEFVIENYGNELLRMRRYDEAREHYSAAIEAFPDRWFLRMSLASVDYNQHGDHRAYVDAWLRHDAPKDAPFYEFILASLSYTTGDIEAALEHARRASVGFERGGESYITAQELSAWIFHDAGLDNESKAAAALAEQKSRKKREERPDDPLPILALARLAALSGDNTAALELAEESVKVAEANSDHRDQYNYENYRVAYGLTLCLANELSAAEQVFRDILGKDAGYTLSFLVEEWPPCKRLFLGTDNYRRLDEEFGHLSHGVPAPGS